MASPDRTGVFGSKSDQFSPPIRITYTPHQLQKLEELFQECKTPTKRMREEWSIELGMDPEQIKHWFKSRVLQAQAEAEQEENNALRAENARILLENVQMNERLRNGAACSSCVQNPSLEELVLENTRLREEHQRMTDILARVVGDGNLDLQLRLAPSALSTSTDESSSEDEETS